MREKTTFNMFSVTISTTLKQIALSWKNLFFLTKYQFMSSPWDIWPMTPNLKDMTSPSGGWHNGDCFGYDYLFKSSPRVRKLFPMLPCYPCEFKTLCFASPIPNFILPSIYACTQNRASTTNVVKCWCNLFLLFSLVNFDFCFWHNDCGKWTHGTRRSACHDTRWIAYFKK